MLPRTTTLHVTSKPKSSCRGPTLPNFAREAIPGECPPVELRARPVRTEEEKLHPIMAELRRLVAHGQRDPPLGGAQAVVDDVHAGRATEDDVVGHGIWRPKDPQIAADLAILQRSDRTDEQC